MNRRSRYYRDIGSGIVRILAENPGIELDNDVEGKEFKVIIWRTIQKDEVTTQRDYTDTQKKAESTQKAEGNFSDSTQKQDKSTKESENSAPESTQKSRGNTQKQIIAILKEYPKTSRKELATLVGITEDGIKKQLEKLKKEGIVKRIGPDKGGYWNVYDSKE